MANLNRLTRQLDGVHVAPQSVMRHRVVANRRNSDGIGRAPPKDGIVGEDRLYMFATTHPARHAECSVGIGVARAQLDGAPRCRQPGVVPAPECANETQRDVARQLTYVRSTAGLGYVPQEREVFASLTVQENLEVAAQGGPWTSERVFELFPQLVLRRNNRGNQLSGGDQQMLSSGRAFMGNPRVLLMDEPSEGLAPLIVEELERTAAKLRDEAGMAIVPVEQHIRLALSFSSRCLVINRGRIIFDGASDGLRDEEVLRSYLSLAA